jgi:hypothetical protein
VDFELLPAMIFIDNPRLHYTKTHHNWEGVYGEDV